MFRGQTGPRVTSRSINRSGKHWRATQRQTMAKASEEATANMANIQGGSWQKQKLWNSMHYQQDKRS